MAPTTQELRAALKWSCDERHRDKGQCRNSHGCHCAEITYQAERIAALEAQPVEGWRMVPVEPTEAMRGNNLVRYIVRWMGYERPTPKSLGFDLVNGYGEIPKWLADEAEMQTPDHVVSKGTRATILYRAMLAAAPAATGDKT